MRLWFDVGSWDIHFLLDLELVLSSFLHGSDMVHYRIVFILCFSNVDILPQGNGSDDVISPFS